MTQEIDLEQAPPRSVGVDGFAIAALVLGIVWLWWVGSVLAIVFGVVALRRIAAGRGTGKGMAVAGLVLGIVGMVVLAVGAVLVLAVGSGSSSSSNFDFGSNDDINGSATTAAGFPAADPDHTELWTDLGVNKADICTLYNAAGGGSTSQSMTAVENFLGWRGVGHDDIATWIAIAVQAC